MALTGFADQGLGRRAAAAFGAARIRKKADKKSALRISQNQGQSPISAKIRIVERNQRVEP
jgi:hypothetical protein